MICVSIVNLDFRRCSTALQDIELAEIRLDELHFSSQQVKDIFSRPQKLIATYRPGKIAENERKEFLLTAIASGATYVDIELETADSFKEPLIQAARRRNCKVIISYHNFEKTPSKSELIVIKNRCFDCGADIAKIACLTLSEADSARILSLYDGPVGEQGKVIALGMGETGKITRIAAPLLGAPFTYAALSPGKKTAPGQLDSATLRKIFGLVTP